MSAPRDHHYIPVFYLKQWATAPDRRVCEFSRPYRAVKPRRTSPKGTGFKRDLYRVEGVPDHLAQVVESKFMGMVDGTAATALDRIIAGDPSPWPPKLRQGWTRFLLSLRFRNPETVADLVAHLREVWKAGIDGLQVDYASKRKPTDPQTVEEFVAQAETEAPQKAALMMLQQIIDDPRTGATIAKMHWSRVTLSGAPFSLLTSDRPLIFGAGLADANASIVLPIGPKALFVAAHDDRLARRFCATNPEHVARQVNLEVVGRARSLVWGIDDEPLRFVQNRISKLPDIVLISEQQKQASIQAARGGRSDPSATTHETPQNSPAS